MKTGERIYLMEKARNTPLENGVLRLWESTARDRLPFVSALIFGLAAHMFAFTNKLVNADEIESLFGKGATVTSGRWGLEAVKLIFPDYSMPWLWGLASLLLLAVSVCLIIRLFDIKGGLIKVLLAGMIVSFPSETGTFCFMFTSTAYALSFLLVVTAAYVFCRGVKLRAPVACLLLVLSLSIYQAYISVAASFFVLYMIKSCLEESGSAVKTIVFGLKALAMMLAALVLYAAVTYAVFRVTGAQFNDYVKDNMNGSGIFARVRMAYDFMVYYLSYREFALITSEASRWLHIILLLLCAAGIIREAAARVKAKRPLDSVLLLVCAAILPLAVNCMFLAMAKDSIHTLVIYSFVAFYVLAAMLLERVFAGGSALRRTMRDVVYVALAAALVSNVYFANEVYLKLYLQYENAYSFYSVLLSRAENAEGFDEDSKLAIIGCQDNALTDLSGLDTGYIMGVNHDLINIYSRENFLRRYLGSDIPLASEAEAEKLAATEEFAKMAEYPYYGSVKMIDGFVVVKLG